MSGTTPERNAPRHNVNLQLLLVIANDCSSQALGPTLLSLGDLAVFGETHLAYDGGGVPAIATAGCGHVLDDRTNGCQDGHRGRAVDPVADCLRCRLASVTDAALMLLRSRRCLELVGAPWWCLGIFSWTKRAIYMASESAAVATSISRARLGVIVCACIFVGLRSTDGHAPCPTPRAVERRAMAGVLRQGRALERER